jgi:ribosomal protein S18 acetylase RimI-like enzyme
MALQPQHTRALSPDDLERVAGIDQAITGRARQGFYAKRLAALSDDPPPFVALGAEHGGRLAGFVLAHVLDGEFGGTAPVGVLDAIGVDPAISRRGVGKLLTAALEAALAARGVRELRTEAEWTEHALVTFFSARGFRLSPRLVLERGTVDRLDDSESESEILEEVVVRSMSEGDLPAIVRLDRKITHRERSSYYARKAAELRHSGVRVSLVAEIDRQFVGFVMARVDFGEFGRTEPTAVLDTIGIDPAFARRRVGRALLQQLLLNLGSLRVERLVTQATWNELALIAFLSRTGFERSQRLSFEKPLA